MNWKKPLNSGFFQVFFVFVRGGDNGLIVDVYHLPRVSVRFAFDVAPSGVVHFDVGGFGACGDFACDLDDVVGHFSSVRDDDRVCAVIVFQVHPYIRR